MGNRDIPILKFPADYQLAQINMILDLHDNPEAGIEGCKACWYEVYIEAGWDQRIIQEIKVIITWNGSSDMLRTFLKVNHWEKHADPAKFIYLTSDRRILTDGEVQQAYHLNC